MSTINITLSHAELQAVDKAAAAAKQTRQQFLQDALAGALKPSKPTPAASTTKATSSSKSEEK